MQKILLGTCVWLDLAKDFRQQAAIGALVDLMKANKIILIVPQFICSVRNVPNG